MLETLLVKSYAQRQLSLHTIDAYFDLDPSPMRVRSAFHQILQHLIREGLDMEHLVFAAPAARNNLDEHLQAERLVMHLEIRGCDMA